MWLSEHFFSTSKKTNDDPWLFFFTQIPTRRNKVQLAQQRVAVGLCGRPAFTSFFCGAVFFTFELTATS